MIVAAFLGAGELATPGLFVLGPVALAALLGALVSGLAAPVWLQLVVFIAASVASLAVLRPIARAHIRLPAIARTGTDALVGRKALVVRRVDAVGGRVRIGGEEWTARPYLDGAVLEEGAQVEVVEIEGATALVME